MKASFDTVDQTLRDDLSTAWKVFERRLVPWWMKAARDLRIKNYWTWDKWPGRRSSGYAKDEKGIDGVAETLDGDLWAVQAKFSDDPHRRLTWDELSTFLALAARPRRQVFAHRVVVTNMWAPGRKLLDEIRDNHGDLRWFGRDSLRSSAVNWERFVESRQPTPAPRRTPLPHQRDVIEKTLNVLASSERAQLRLACGTGKTLIGLWLAEKLKARRILVLVPTITLVRQTLREWMRDAQGAITPLAVCSDVTVSQDDASTEIAAMVGLPSATTTPSEIAAFLSRRDATLVVFSTYQSSPAIAAGQRISRKNFDLVIADEAHRTAGAVRGPFATLHSPRAIRRKRTVFMTATPRIFSVNVKQAARAYDVELASMDDEAMFGPVAARLSFGEAIARGLLCDYQVVALGISDADVAKAVRRRELADTGNAEPVDAERVAAVTGVAKAIQRFRLRRVLTFHSRIAAARAFSSIDHSNGLRALGRELRLRLPQRLWTQSVSGEMSSGERAEILFDFDSSVGTAVLSNARCLTEGIDVPAIDAIAFVDPRQSKVDIVQAIGRAIRRAPETPSKTVGTIICPLVVDREANAETFLEDDQFRRIGEVLLALRAHDERLADALDAYRTALGERRRPAAHHAAFLRDHLKLDFANVNARDVARGIIPRLVRLTSPDALELVGLLRRYVFNHGWTRLTANTRFEGIALGRWAIQCRHDGNSNALKPWLREALEAIPGWTWDLERSRYLVFIAALRSYVSVHGWDRLNFLTKHEGLNIGMWVSNRRSDHRKGRLEEWVAAALEAIDGWTWNPKDYTQRTMLDLLEEYIAKFGWERFNARTAYKGKRIGAWVDSVRGRTSRKPPWLIEAVARIPGWSWDPFEDQFRHDLEIVRRYVQRHGWSEVRDTVFEGLNIGTWTQSRRSQRLRGKLSEGRVKALESIPGWSWDPIGDRLRASLRLVKDFVRRNGLGSLRQSTVYEGEQLGSWVNARRQAHRKGKLPLWLSRELGSIPGWRW